MTRLIWNDLVAHARVWGGTLAVVIAVGFVGALAGGLLETGMAHGGRIEEALMSAASVVVSFAALTALVVLSSAANLAVALHTRSYALWQLVGIHPGLVGVVVLAQLAIVAVVGSIVGCLIATPLFRPILDWVFGSWNGMPGLPLSLSVGTAALVVAGVTGVVVVGGLRGARRASRVPAVAALREPEPGAGPGPGPGARVSFTGGGTGRRADGRVGRVRWRGSRLQFGRVQFGWFRALLTVAALIATISLAQGLRGSDFSGIASRAILLTPLIAGVFAGIGPLVFPLALSAWTALVPRRASSSWFLARHSARYRLSQSSAAINPLMVGITLAGGLFTTAATLGTAVAATTGRTGSFELAPEGVVLMLGGPLLLAAIGAAATVFMSSGAREREFALLQAAGATRGVIIKIALWEALISAVTATLLAVFAIGIGGLVLAHALGMPAPTLALSSAWLVAGGGLVLLLAATVLPTLAALRREIPHLLAVE